MKLNKQNLVNKLGYTKVQADWYLKMATMIKVEDDGTVDARKLHEVLGSKRQFADWIKQRIEKYDFVENVDYTSVHKFVNVNFTQDEVNAMSPQQRSRYGITTEYKLTVNMAKELSMIENNEVGKEFRKYFIMSEEIAHKAIGWENTRESNVIAHEELTATFKREFMDKHNGRQPQGWMYGQLQNDVYWIVFGVDANSMKEVLEIKHYESIPNNVVQQIDEALTWTYNRMQMLIEMGMIDNREERTNKVAEMFDKKFGGIIEF